MILTIHNKTELIFKDEIFTSKFARFLDLMSDHLKQFNLNKEDQIELFLVDDPEIQNINRDFRHQDKPTDVISCAYLEADTFLAPGPKVIGDLFISIDTAKKQATERSHSTEKELEILFVHGLLHLFGFDHQNDAEEAAMEEKAKLLLGY